MCRYAFHKYKPHYVCFTCRKTFKQPLLEDIIMKNGDWKSYHQAFLRKDSNKSKKFRANNPDLIRRFEKQYLNKKYKCPECAQEMHNIGMDFKAPKKDDSKKWKIVEGMYTIGRSFHSCGCHGPGFIPVKKADYYNYLKKVQSDYEKRLEERPENVTISEIEDYIEYWNVKLTRVQNELKSF